MSYTRSKYPVGATWEAVGGNGKIGHIWLSSIEESFEIWRWSAAYSDGSGVEFDWGTSYNMCRKEIPVYTRERQIRFKRIK